MTAASRWTIRGKVNGPCSRADEEPPHTGEEFFNRHRSVSTSAAAPKPHDAELDIGFSFQPLAGMTHLNPRWFVPVLISPLPRVPTM